MPADDTREGDGIRPALTEQEWRTLRYTESDGVDWLTIRLAVSPSFGPNTIEVEGYKLGLTLADLHKLAAFCLLGQPYGFTRQDIALLTRLCLSARDLSRDEFRAADNLAGRIAALLPPEP